MFKSQLKTESGRKLIAYHMTIDEFIPYYLQGYRTENEIINDMTLDIIKREHLGNY